ncbi:MAG: DUF4347 domain-containing protein, partial [Fuerstiella sp.]|nr:DUF4347 domain-containing protein [Fuerstiella sp.]
MKRALQAEERGGDPVNLVALESRVLMSATPMALVAALDADLMQQDTAVGESESATNGDIAEQTTRDHESPTSQPLATTDAALMLLDNLLVNSPDEFSATDSEDTTRSLANEIVFLDTAVDDYETLMAGIDPEAQIVLLDSSRDGVEQIAETLEGRTGLDAIHIVSHSTDGRVKLGETWLDFDSLGGYASEISAWGSALSADADLLFYGCSMAASSDGQLLVDSLSTLTGADVAASTDDTGHAIFGADWDLEYTAGQIETEVAFSQDVQQNWGHLLNVAVDATSTGTVAKGNSSDTISHTTSGSDRLMLVGISFGEDKGDSVSSVTYNGTSLTLVGARDNSDTATARVEIWKLVAPVTGTHNVVVNISGTSHEGATIGVMTFTGVNQTTAVGSFASAQGDSSSPSATVSSAADEIVFGVAAFDDSSNWNFSPGAGQTERWDLFTDKTNGAGSTEAGAASVVTSWSVGSSHKWAAGGVSIKKANAAPVLSDTAVTLNAVLEDSGAPSGVVGTLISDFADLNPPAGGQDNVTDADTSAVTGIAVTAADTTNGTWHYSTNGGTNWNSLGAVSNGSARLLAADASTRIYFQANSNYDGTIASALTFRAWDQAYGTANGTTGVDTSTNGGTTAYSSATDTASINVTAVNDEPSFTNLNGTPTFTEDGAAVVLDADVVVSDVELDALNSSNGDYDGASVTLVRNGGVSTDDVFSFSDGNGITLETSTSLNKTVLQKSGATIAIFDTTTIPGELKITFTNANGQTPTSADVDHILQQIIYANSSDTPPASTQIDWAFDDGNTGSQGTGGALQALGSTTVTITAVNDAPNFDTASFTTHTITTGADGASSTVAMDIDGDGDPDVLSADQNIDQIAWYENDGSGSFIATHVVSTNADAVISVTAADVDGDGDMDILSASFSDNKVAWYENDGAENFTEHTITTGANGALVVTTADVDGDGDMDVLSASQTDDTVTWYENDGSQNFSKHDISTGADKVKSITTADVDGDGDIDVLSASYNDDKIAWYENDGSEGFTEHVITTGANGAQSVTTADIDGDGDLDVLSASSLDDTVAWYENDGSQGFTQHLVTAGAVYSEGARSVTTADMDGDGDLDVLLAAYIDFSIVWYENDGSETFTEHLVTSDADQAKWITTGDMDGDGDLDILSASFSDDTIAWYENTAVTTLDGTPTFIEGGAAVVLDADVDVSDVELDALNGGLGNYDGASVTLARNGGANADDVFSNTGLLSALTESGALVYNGTTIGTVTTNSGGTLVLTFNTNATSAL